VLLFSLSSLNLQRFDRDKIIWFNDLIFSEIFTFKNYFFQNHEKLFSIALLFVSVILFAQDKAPNYVAANYTKKEAYQDARMYLYLFSKGSFKKYPIIMQGLLMIVPRMGRSIQRISPSETMMKRAI
jgi:hypothetical protein